MKAERERLRRQANNARERYGDTSTITTASSDVSLVVYSALLHTAGYLTSVVRHLLPVMVLVVVTLAMVDMSVAVLASVVGGLLLERVG